MQLKERAKDLDNKNIKIKKNMRKILKKYLAKNAPL